MSTWACTIPLCRHIPFIFPFCFEPPFVIPPSDSDCQRWVLGIQICSGTSLCIPFTLLCQNIYHFSITMLGQDKTFTIPCRFDINIYHFSITVLSLDKTFYNTVPGFDITFLSPLPSLLFVFKYNASYDFCIAPLLVTDFYNSISVANAFQSPPSRSYCFLNTLLMDHIPVNILCRCTAYAANRLDTWH